MVSTRNPIDRLTFAKLRRREVQTVPAAIVERMLLDSLQNDADLLPFLVLAFFCGCRPNGELQKIEWRDVHFNDEHPQVVIRSEVSKTRERRFIDLSENACAWLQAYLDKRGHPAASTKIAPFSFHILRKMRRQNWTNAREGRMKWIPQGARHTFCSCWLAKHKDVNKLLLHSGHGSLDILRKSYHRATPQEEAEKFWSIMPPKEDEKLIAFPFTHLPYETADEN